MYKDKKGYVYFTLPEAVRKEQEALDKMWTRFVMQKPLVDVRVEAVRDKKADTTEEG